MIYHIITNYGLLVVGEKYGKRGRYYEVILDSINRQAIWEDSNEDLMVQREIYIDIAYQIQERLLDLEFELTPFGVRFTGNYEGFLDHTGCEIKSTLVDINGNGLEELI